MTQQPAQDVVERLREYLTLLRSAPESIGKLGKIAVLEPDELDALLAVVEAARELDEAWLDGFGFEARHRDLHEALARLYDGSSGDA